MKEKREGRTTSEAVKGCETGNETKRDRMYEVESITRLLANQLKSKNTRWGKMKRVIEKLAEGLARSTLRGGYEGRKRDEGQTVSVSHRSWVRLWRCLPQVVGQTVPVSPTGRGSDYDCDLPQVVGQIKKVGEGAS